MASRLSRLGKEQAPRGYVSAVLGRTSFPRPGRGREITESDKLISTVGWTCLTDVQVMAGRKIPRLYVRDERHRVHLLLLL